MPPDLQNIIGLIHLPSLLRCEPKLIQYLLPQNKAFRSTVSEKPSHVQHTDCMDFLRGYSTFAVFFEIHSMFLFKYQYAFTEVPRVLFQNTQNIQRIHT